jgi:23S rRNA pseudouridine1911/1915/1917 synthase
MAESGDLPAGTHRVTAAEGDAGERLDRMLAARLDGLSRSRLKRLIEEGRVRGQAGAIRDPSARVKAGQVFSIEVPAPVADRPRPEPIALDIRYEDEHLLVLDKPAGLVVHPAPGNLEGTLVNALLAHCGDRLPGIGGVKRPGIVHRLDKDTSGLMVVAKSDLAHARLVADFAARRIERAYYALVWGVPLPPQGEIAGNIGRSPANRKKMAVLRSGGRAALTRYRVVRAFGRAAALLECRLATGRTHQIRVHLSERGHPLIGDPTYGGGATAARCATLGTSAVAAFGSRRQALHAHLLGFEHPATGELLRFESRIPRDMEELVKILDRFQTGQRPSPELGFRPHVKE